MQAPELIVVPVDLDQHSQKLVDFAISMANNLGCEIALFHCVESIESIATEKMALAQFSHKEFDSTNVKKAEEVLHDFMKKTAGKCEKCRSKIAIGNPVEEILDYAENEKANMIIIGTHGKQGLTKILLGSVAGEVLRRAHCPVLVMNPYR